jgi:hypothetical protein
MRVESETYAWRDFPEIGARIEHPLLRQPLTLIVDDPTPAYNPAYFHSGFRNGPLYVDRGLIDEFADLIETTGIRGKFSIIPYPFGFGRVDRDVQGVSAADVTYFLDVVRARIAPLLDVTPEALTHWNALDLRTGQLLPYWEHIWSRQQTRESLTPYMALSLEILANVGFDCSGVTSPWDFGDGVEREYAEAILAAQRAVHGRTLTWYFLQMDGTSRRIPPRLPVFRPERGEAVVSIVVCDAYDFGRGVWSGGQPDPDMLITADGTAGRLVETLTAGGPVAFHTHWQTMFSQGTRRGMAALAEVARRVEAHFGQMVTWTRCSDLAQYAAASAAVQITTTRAAGGAISLTTHTPFACPTFTLSVPVSQPIPAVHVDGRPLQPSSTGSLAPESYTVVGDRLYLCWSLAGMQQVTIGVPGAS